MKKLACLMVVAVLLVVSMIPAAAAGINDYEKKIIDYMKTAYVVDGVTITAGGNFFSTVENIFAKTDVTEAQYNQIMSILGDALKYCQSKKLVKIADIKKQGATKDLLKYGSDVLAVLGYTLSTSGHIADADDLTSATAKLIIKDASGATVAEFPLAITRSGLAKTGADYSAATVCGVAAVAVLAAASVAVKKNRKETDED
ncbi:MAG: hypothetical protein IJK26_03825 [Clostridia bacterium]|nr:hypothetical protein [Clostridia bacterium]